MLEVWDTWEKLVPLLACTAYQKAVDRELDGRQVIAKKCVAELKNRSPKMLIVPPIF